MLQPETIRSNRTYKELKNCIPESLLLLFLKKSSLIDVLCFKYLGVKCVTEYDWAYFLYSLHFTEVVSFIIFHTFWITSSGKLRKCILNVLKMAEETWRLELLFFIRVWNTLEKNLFLFCGSQILEKLRDEIPGNVLSSGIKLILVCSEEVASKGSNRSRQK